MALTHDNSRFFGLDLSQWPRQWRAAGRLLAGLPVFARLSPDVPVALRQADGRVTIWRVAHGVAVADGAGAIAGFAGSADRADAIPALELSPDRVLERRLTLPPLADADLAQAVALDVAANSPFPAGQTVHGYAVQGGGRVDVAMTSRAQVDLAQIEARAAGWHTGSIGGADGARGIDPEIWVIPSAANRNNAVRPIVIQGYGEHTRERRAARGFGLHLALIALGAALLVALLVTPTALMRARAHQAMAAQDALQRQAGPETAAREALLAQVGQMQALRDLVGQQIALPPALDMMTRAVPDGAWLTSLRVEGAKLTLNGNADDATALVQKLAREPGVREARLASPATRGAGASKENFIIELQLDPARYGLVQGVAPVTPTPPPEGGARPSSPDRKAAS